MFSLKASHAITGIGGHVINTGAAMLTRRTTTVVFVDLTIHTWKKMGGKSFFQGCSIPDEDGDNETAVRDSCLRHS